MSFPEKKRWKQTGRGKSPSFLALPHTMLSSEAWATLSGTEVKMLIELARQFNGRNNGAFRASWEYLKGHGWISKSTIQNVLKSLEDKQWTKKTRQGGRDKRCTLYAVTWLPINASNNADEDAHNHAEERVASHAWKENRLPRKSG